MQFDRSLVALTPRVFMTWVFVAANVAVFVAMLIAGVSAKDPDTQSLIRWGAAYGPLTLGGEPWRLLSSTFVHIGFIHLLMNMAVLASVGPFVERLFGNLGYAVIYLFAGLAGSVATVVWSPDVVSAGASGAIFGVYGALLGFLLRNRHTIPSEVLRGLLQRAGTTLVINIVWGITQPRIGMAAHLGGLAGGFIGALILAQPIDARAAKRRIASALGLAAAGPGVFVASAFLLPKPADVSGEYERFVSVQKTVVDAYNTALRAYREDGDDAAFAATIEGDVLPPWEKELDSLKHLTQVPSSKKVEVDRWTRFVEARANAWRDLASALEAHDTKAAKEASEALNAAKLE
jgi:rhomboid protease GluP